MPLYVYEYRNLYRTSRSNDSHATALYCLLLCSLKLHWKRNFACERTHACRQTHRRRLTLTHTHRFIHFILHILVNVVVGFLLLLLLRVHYASKNLNENCRGARLQTNEQTNGREKQLTIWWMFIVYCCHEIICYFVLSDLYIFFFRRFDHLPKTSHF